MRTADPKEVERLVNDAMAPGPIEPPLDRVRGRPRSLSDQERHDAIAKAHERSFEWWSSHTDLIGPGYFLEYFGYDELDEIDIIILAREGHILNESEYSDFSRRNWDHNRDFQRKITSADQLLKGLI